MEDDNDAIAQRLAAMERDVLKREAAAEQKRLALLKEVEQEEKEARMARIQFEHARRESLGDNHGTWASVQDPANASKMESWSQSSWFKLVIVLIVAGVVTSVMGLAWMTVPSLAHHHRCDPQVAGKLRDEIHAATSVAGKNHVERFYHQDLCFGNTTVITIPAGVTVNITAEPPIKLHRFRFVLSPTAQLYLANVALTGAKWMGSEGGAAAAVRGTIPIPRTSADDPAKTEAIAAVKKSVKLAEPNTTFTCINCIFENNMQWTYSYPNMQSIAKGGAVYVDGEAAHFKCVNCTFTGNTARAIGSAALDGYESYQQGTIGASAPGGSENATVHGGAVYVGQGNITLITPRFKNNLAICLPSAIKTGCTAAANDVYLESGAVEMGCKELARGPHPVCGLHSKCEDYSRCSHHADPSLAAPCGVLCLTNHTSAPTHNHSHPPPPPAKSR